MVIRGQLFNQHDWTYSRLNKMQTIQLHFPMRWPAKPDNIAMDSGDKGRIGPWGTVVETAQHLVHKNPMPTLRNDRVSFVVSSASLSNPLVFLFSLNYLFGVFVIVPSQSPPHLTLSSSSRSLHCNSLPLSIISP